MTRFLSSNAVCGVLLAASTLVCAGCQPNKGRSEIVYFPAPPATARVVHLKSFNSLDELVPVRHTLLEVLRGRSISPFVDTPAGIAYADNKLYICDTGLNAVHVWDLAEGKAKRIGTSGDTILQKPVDVAVDEDGTVYVADSERGEVIGFWENGPSFLPCKHPGDAAFRPVAVTASHGTIAAADIASHQILECTSGALHGGVGSEPGKFYYPTGLARDEKGNWLVADMMNGRIQILDESFSPQRSIGQPGDRYSDIGKLKHLDVAPDGTIIAADSAFSHVHLFNPQGQLLMLLGGPGDEPGDTPMPFGVAVAAQVTERIAALVPPDFAADYYLFVSNTIGAKRINLFAVGKSR